LNAFLANIINLQDQPLDGASNNLARNSFSGRNLGNKNTINPLILFVLKQLRKPM